MASETLGGVRLPYTEEVPHIKRQLPDESFEHLIGREYWVEIEYVRDVLGTVASSEILKDHVTRLIQEAARKGTLVGVDEVLRQQLAKESVRADELATKGITGFYTYNEIAMLFPYQMKGVFKEQAKMLDSMSCYVKFRDKVSCWLDIVPVHYDCYENMEICDERFYGQSALFFYSELPKPDELDIEAFPRLGINVKTRHNDQNNYNVRSMPLKDRYGEPGSCLNCSMTIPRGAKMRFRVQVAKGTHGIDEQAVYRMLAGCSKRAVGQWRSSGYGAFRVLDIIKTIDRTGSESIPKSQQKTTGNGKDKQKVGKNTPQKEGSQGLMPTARYEIYYVYRGGSTNHAGPLFGLQNAKLVANRDMVNQRSLLCAYIIPYTAGSFHPDHAVAKISRYQECPRCHQRYDPHT